MAITIFLVLKQLLKIQSSGAVLGGEGVFSEPRGGGLGWGKWGVSTDLSPKYELVSIKIPQRRIVSCSISARAQRKHSVRNPDKAVHKDKFEWMNEWISVVRGEGSGKNAWMFHKNKCIYFIASCLINAQCTMRFEKKQLDHCAV